MADEIQISTKIYAAKGGAYLGSHTNSSTLDMTGTHMAEWTQTIGTTYEAIATPADITGDYYIEIKSLEAEGGNYVQIALDTSITQIFCKLKGAGLAMSTIPSGVTVYAKANTAAVNVQCRACQV